MRATEFISIRIFHRYTLRWLLFFFCFISVVFAIRFCAAQLHNGPSHLNCNLAKNTKSAVAALWGGWRLAATIEIFDVCTREWFHYYSTSLRQSNERSICKTRRCNLMLLFCVSTCQFAHKVKVHSFKLPNRGTEREREGRTEGNERTEKLVQKQNNNM